MSMGAIVAKKKVGRGGASKPQESPSERVDFLRVRVSGSYKEWVARLAEFCRSDMSDLIDNALVRHAKEVGFKEAPPKR